MEWLPGGDVPPFTGTALSCLQQAFGTALHFIRCGPHWRAPRPRTKGAGRMKAMSKAAPMSLQELDEFFLSDAAPDGGMMLSDLDGFLTAVAIGPEQIKPSEWLPRIWGDETPEFLSEEQANRVIGTILGRYNQIITQLRDDPGRYQPLIRQNEHGQVIARDWVAGFIMDGVALRFHGWQA